MLPHSMRKSLSYSSWCASLSFLRYLWETLCVQQWDMLPVSAAANEFIRLFCWHNTIIVGAFEFKHPINIEEATWMNKQRTNHTHKNRCFQKGKKKHQQKQCDALCSERCSWEKSLLLAFDLVGCSGFFFSLFSHSYSHSKCDKTRAW